ncbi:MAG: hypothetical protein J6S67_24970 [Methanobrevibacter sp.]|nr:hypothetical protein [Methanobrevibacter sp.]
MNLIEEQNTILKALVVYWDCRVCEELGWDKDCEKSKDDCCFTVYDHLRDHIHAIDECKARLKR